jgi:hypothetical protein
LDAVYGGLQRLVPAARIRDSHIELVGPRFYDSGKCNIRRHATDGDGHRGVGRSGAVESLARWHVGSRRSEPDAVEDEGFAGFSRTGTVGESAGRPDEVVSSTPIGAGSVRCQDFAGDVPAVSEQVE